MTSPRGGNPAAPPAGFSPDPLAAKVPLWLPMGFVAVGLVSGLLLAVGAAAFWPEFDFVRLQPRLLALVHLFTLGFGSAAAMGVTYQMAPVIFVTRLYSVSLGWLSLAVFAPGAALIIGSFYVFSVPGLAAGAALTVAGASLFMYNIWRTWQTAPRGNIARNYMLAAVISFWFTLVAGFAIAALWRFGGHPLPGGADPLGAHLFLGGGGWFIGLVIGVSYPLVGMFRLVHGHDEKRAAVILPVLYTGVGLGVLGPFTGAADPAGPWLTGAGLLLVAAAVFVYVYDFAIMWRSGLRPPDVWTAQVLPAVGYMALSAAGALAVFIAGRFGADAGAPLYLAIGLMFVFGFVGTLIIALLHKIIPFLVWYHRYMSRIGRGEVPLMKDLVDESRGKAGFAVYHVSLAAAIAATAAGAPHIARFALAVMAAGYAVLISDLVRLLRPEAGNKEVAADATEA